MKKFLHIEENFLDPSFCQPFIDLYGIDKEDRPIDAVTHSDPTETLTYIPNQPFDKNYGARYLGGNVDPINMESVMGFGSSHHDTDSRNPKKNPQLVNIGGTIHRTDKLFANVINDVTTLCKSFENDIALDYVGVVRWPIGTFMKPHVDDNNVHREDVFAAMLYLNDDFKGGATVFEEMEVKPETGKLVIFTNGELLHYVSKVEEAERFVLSFWYSRP